MEKKHTPGPWTVHREGEEYPLVVTGDGSKSIAYVGEDRAQVFGKGMPQQANARLIAAAPDLLALLDRAVELVPEHNAQWHDDARAALARVSGAAG